MSANSSQDEDEITGINVTPLVDVMLVLLIVFMATATYIANKSLDIKLPQAETAAIKDSPNQSISFVLDKNSNLSIDGKKSSLAEIKSYLDELHKKQKAGQQLSAVITADEMTMHGEVVKLIDGIRKSGITDFAINVEAKPPTP